MVQLDSDLTARLSSLSRQGLLRELRRVDSPQSVQIRIAGTTLLNFSSNDYLGLANHPRLKSAAVEAIEKYGAGGGASRLICGSLKPHHELEESLASFKGTAAALSFSSGYAAAIGMICALMRKEDVIILDQLIHASIIDAARLCGAKLEIFPHNDLNHLKELLQISKQARGKVAKPHRRSPASPLNSSVGSSRTLIITESIFSMDGDRAPLREIVGLKEKYGAWLMLDEAHATGLYGPRHRGIADELGVSDQIEIQMGTLGKALGAAGGYICGSRPLIDYLINRARPFIFSTAPVPAAVAAAKAAIGVAQSAEGDSRRKALWARVSQLVKGTDIKISPGKSPIIPFIIGNEVEAIRVAAGLRDCGIFVPAIRYPTVARNKARLRLTLSAAHTSSDVRKLSAALAKMNHNTLPLAGH